MVLIFPGWLFAIQEIQQLLAADLIPCGFYKEGTATAGSYKSIDLVDQIFWQKNVCAHRIHIVSVLYACDLVKTYDVEH
jgi:hypothetical protein